MRVELWPLQVFELSICGTTMIASDAATNENRPGVGAGFENLTTEKLGISPGGLLIRSGGAKPM